MTKNRLVGQDNIIRMEVIDDYTLRFILKKLHSTFAYDTGAAQMFSPTAIQKNGEEWARKNAVCTGPFKLAEFQRDTYMRYEKNEDYWQKGKPYLDGMETRFIPDTMTAAALIESGEADMWLYASAITSVIDLEEKGFKTVEGPGMFLSILPDTKSPDSKYKDKYLIFPEFIVFLLKTFPLFLHFVIGKIPFISKLINLNLLKKV